MPKIHNKAFPTVLTVLCAKCLLANIGRLPHKTDMGNLFSVKQT